MSEAPEIEGAAKPKDPMGGFRGVCSATLVLEAIVMVLTFAVVEKLYGGLTALPLAWIIGSIVLLIGGCAIQSKPWAMWFNLALQVLIIAGFVLNFAIGSVGVVFAFVWGYLVWIQRDMQKRIAAAAQQ
jgi:cellobiose-specific phosphotransferase system component IIC